MSILGGAIGAGAVLAAIGHEMSLAREAERINEEVSVGEEDALVRERAARETRIRDMRDITKAQMQSKLLRAGMVPMQGRAARAVQLSEASRARRPRRY